MVLFQCDTTDSFVVMDWFMIICYLLILLAIFTNVIITVLLRGSDREKLFAKRLGSRVRYAVWFFGPGLFTFLFFSKKLLWIPFLFIILPTALLLGIRRLVMRYRHEKAKRVKPQKHPLHHPDEDDPYSPSSFEEDTTESTEEEDIPPSLAHEIGEIDTRRAALAGEIGRSQTRPRTASTYGLEASGSSDGM